MCSTSGMEAEDPSEGEVVKHKEGKAGKGKK